MSLSGGPTRRWRRRPLKRQFGVLLGELDDVPSSAFVAQAFTAAKLVKGFNRLVAATLAADPIVEGGHRVVSPTLDQLASAACLSVNHFIRAFRQQTGVTPPRHVVLRRLALCLLYVTCSRAEESLALVLWAKDAS